MDLCSSISLHFKDCPAVFIHYSNLNNSLELPDYIVPSPQKSNIKCCLLCLQIEGGTVLRLIIMLQIENWEL